MPWKSCLGLLFLTTKPSQSCFSALPDYDAVLTEAGDYTSKFFKLRQLFSMVIGNGTPCNHSSAPPTLADYLNWELFKLRIIYIAPSAGALVAWEWMGGGLEGSWIFVVWNDCSIFVFASQASRFLCLPWLRARPPMVPSSCTSTSLSGMCCQHFYRYWHLF